MGREKGHQLFIERRVANPRGDKDYRQFGSYADVETLSRCIEQGNFQLFEILPPEQPVKLYLDFDQSPDTPGVIDDCTRMLKEAHLRYFGVALEDEQIFVSCSSGRAEEGKWAGKSKVSYHLAVNNGMAFQSVQACKKFMQATFPCGFLDVEVPAGTDPPVDLAPYSSYQSFRMIYQSKTSTSDRVLVPSRGGWEEHLISQFANPPMLYNMERLEEEVKKELKNPDQGTRTRLPPVHINRPSQDAGSANPAAVDPHSVADLLRYLPNHIDQPWGLFFIVACICKNERVPFEVFDQWCQQSPKYHPNEAWAIYHGLEPRLVSSPGQPARNIATLRRLVEQCNPGIFDEALARWVHQCIYPTIDFAELGIKQRSYASRFVKPFSQPWECYPHFLLRSHMGTGKTTQAVAAIRAMEPSSVLIITPRQTLATSSMGAYREALPQLMHYQKSPHIEEEGFLVCQLESLWRLSRAYDVVILDESESILAQFSSETVTRFQAVTSSFKRIIQTSQKTLWMDAFLNDRTIQTCLALVQEPSKMRVTENTYQPTCRTAQFVGRGTNAKAAIKGTLNDLIDQGEKLVFVSASRQLLEEVEDLLPQPRLCITSRTPDSTKAKLSNANALLSQYDHIGYTGSITVGVNYDLRNHFSSLVMYFSAASATVRDMMQSSMRVRHLGKDRMFYATYPKYHGSVHFDVFNREKLADIIHGRVEYHRNIKPADDPLWMQRQDLEPWLMGLWVFNQQERNVSAFHFERLLEAYLRLCGYTCTNSQLEQLLDVVGSVRSLDDVAYGEVPSVGHAEFQETLGRLQRGAASEMDKLVVSKYYMDNHMIAPDAQPGPDVKHDLFKVILKHQSEIINKMHNLKQEHRQPHTNPNSNVFQDNRVAKAQHMREICSALNVPHSQHVEAVIDHVTMQHTCQEILEKKEALRVAFGLRYQESRQAPHKDIGVKRGLEILNAMLASWGHTQIQKNQKRKLVSQQGRRMDHTPYKVVVLGRPESEEHQKNRLCLENLDVRPR
ncbi:hypothetical protein WJX74_003600 [Apatococcus lobatus]|uniref:Replication origin-binding protein domain-containing protein n=1 Tax=Apatococcus lobatus TaxID=904363 RepID=A0AAW1RLE9_9CHLO